MTINEKGVTIYKRLRIISNKFASFLYITSFFLWPYSAFAPGKEIHVLPVVDSSTSETDVKMTSHVRGALKRPNLDGWHFIWGNESGEIHCTDTYCCMVVTTVKKGMTYTISLSLPGKKIIATRESTFKPGSSLFDMAETVALKIIFMLQKAKIKIPENSKKFTDGKNKIESIAKLNDTITNEKTVETMAEIEDTAESEKTDPTIGSSTIDGPSNPDEGPKTPLQSDETGNEKRNIPAEDKNKVDEQLMKERQPGYPRTGAGKKRKIFHLGLNAAYMTGFTSDFNTGGLELNGIFNVYGPVALRLDAGFHPIGGASGNGISLKYYTLPINVMGGYFKSLRRIHIGIYGGLTMMAMWFNYQAASLGDSFDFVIGAALLFELTYVINDTVSLGIFARPAYISDNVEVRDDQMDVDQEGDNDGNNAVIFTLPKFLLACGVSLIVSF